MLKQMHTRTQNSMRKVGASLNQKELAQNVLKGNGGIMITADFVAAGIKLHAAQDACTTMNENGVQDYRFTEPARPPRYAGITFARSPRSIDPGGISPASRLRLVLAACDQEDGIGFRSFLLTGLYRFTVSHCGSHAPLPTPKPRLTASAPRLSTGARYALPGPVSHRTILPAPNWRIPTC